MAGPPVYLIAYDVVSFLSALVLAAAILTVICSNQLRRGKGWLGLMSCWLVYSLSYGILVGRQTGPEPAFAHCFVQSVLIYSAPPLAAVGTLCFYLDFYLGSCWDPTRRRSLPPRVAHLLLVLPWIVHIAVDIEVVILVFRSKTEPVVKRRELNLYCHLHNNGTPALVNAVIVVLTMAFLIPLEVRTGIQLYRSRAIRANADFREYLAVYLRMAACTLAALIAVGLSVITMADAKEDSIVQDLSFPCLSMALSLIFASQQDILNVWLCRRRRPLSGPSSELVRPISYVVSEEPKTRQYNPTPNPDSSSYGRPSLNPSRNVDRHFLCRPLVG